jgi:hypothetical protein
MYVCMYVCMYACLIFIGVKAFKKLSDKMEYCMFNIIFLQVMGLFSIHPHPPIVP